MERILAAAKAIASARRSRAPLKALPKDVVPRDEAEGYQVQYALHDLLQPQVGSLVGYKIGCTSAVMQEYINIPHPCGGGVFEKVVHDSGVRLPAADFVHVGVECEIAVRLARNLAASEAPLPPNGSRKRSRPTIPRLRSSTTAMSNGRRSARRR